MKRLVLVSIAVMLVTASGCTAPPKGAEPDSEAPTKREVIDYSKLLSPADVEKATGVDGIKLVARDPAKGAGGDLNFADKGGKMVLMANFGDKAWFDANIDGPNYREPLEGLGDQAFVGPSADISRKVYQVGVRKGDTGCLLTSFIDADGEVIVDEDELAAVAKAVLANSK